MNKYLEQAQAAIQDPERAQKIDLVDEEVHGYEKAFDKLVEMKKQRNEYVFGTLNVIGPKMEQALTRIMESGSPERYRRQGDYRDDRNVGEAGG
jgi:hypothetical protein